MELRSLIWKLLKEQVDQNTLQLKNKYVGEGKPLSEEDFNKLIEVTGNKFYLLSWLTKKVGQGIIKPEDIYKYKEYFDIFEKNKNKNKFQHKDIHLYKTAEDVQKFIDEVIKIREGDIKFEDITNNQNFVSKSEIEKLESGGGIKYMGIWKPDRGLKDLSKDGYQVFEVSKPTKENWKLYRDILGRCKGRDKGAKIEICTIGDYDYFKQYLKEPKGSSYFVLFNLNDPTSPYQLHIESAQFMNKNDSRRYNFPVLPFYIWLTTKSSRYNFDFITKHVDLEVPAPNKGFEDEKGKQGTWIEYEDGYKKGIVNYKNNKWEGPFVRYWENGKVAAKGSYRNGIPAGEFVSYNEDGTIDEKGVLSNKGGEIGVWQKPVRSPYTDDVESVQFDSEGIQPTSGFTKNGTLRIVSDPSPLRGFHGKTVTFYETGQPKAIGALTPTTGVRTGNWIYFFRDGSIKAEGKFKNDDPVGEWTFVFKRDNKKFIYVINLSDGRGKGYLYNSQGEYLRRMKFQNKLIPDYQKLFEI